MITSDASVVCVVSQGSIVGATLFLNYTKDLCEQSIITGKIFSYADNTTIGFHDVSWGVVHRFAESGQDYSEA